MMHFKYYYIFVFVIISSNLFSECESTAVKEFIMDKIIRPIQSVFPHKENNVTESKAKEHGNLDSFGRDIILGTSKKFKQLKDNIQWTFSKVTKGLDCNKTISGGRVDTFKLNIQAIYPGTKWCGDGNISETYDDLGKYYLTDSCCREHDLCPDSIASDTTKYGLLNNGLFTRSHCDCDKRFYECLKEANTRLSRSIGFTYFSILGPQCFKQDYPTVECLEKQKNKCVKYQTDHYGEKLYQWFDSPAF